MILCHCHLVTDTVCQNTEQIGLKKSFVPAQRQSSGIIVLTSYGFYAVCMCLLCNKIAPQG